MAIRTVTYNWDDSHGNCYDCGDPAAFVCPDLYLYTDGSNANEPVNENNIFCAICAANHACDGERIFHMFVEDKDSLTREHMSFLYQLKITNPQTQSDL